MARIKEDNISNFDELNIRFELVKDDFKNHFNISGLSHIKEINGVMYLYFIDTNGLVSDRIRYTYVNSDGKEYKGDHVVKGMDLNEIYRDLEFITVNYIFGVIC